MEPLKLVELALEAREHAYVPYSKFAVGAALECRGGRVFTGCNVENAALGDTICAERTACVKGFHSLRHTAITLSLQNGATVASVRRLAGHASERMQQRYTHLGADTAGQASDAIGAFW